jgi:uncharacterized protein YbjT (DUF2867 family)
LEVKKMKRKILLTGATGTIGAELARRLAAYDTVELRVLVRNSEKASDLQALGVEVAQGTFDDGVSLRAALEGVDTVVLITPFDPTAADQAHAVIVAAQEAPVRRVVRLSVVKADPNGPSDSYRQHGRTDAEIQASGLTYTIVRPNTFMQTFFTDMVETILRDNTIHMTFGDGHFAMIDTRDIVDVFEQVLLSDTYDDQILTLTGPASISLYEAARIFSQALGRGEITYVPVPPDEIEQWFRESWGLEGWYLTTLCDYSVAFSQNHQDFTTDDVERVTGHSPRSLDAFAKEIFAPMLRQ